jgi:hypothetical protein
VGNASGKSTTVSTSSFGGGGTINTGSLVTTASFNAYTQSTNGRLTNIESTTASLLVETQNLELFSASALVSISNLNSATSSYVTETESGSFLLTASFDNGTRNLTFTKGNNTTFAVNIPDVSGSSFNTASFTTTASFNAYTASTDSSISQLNASSASQQVSINALNVYTASQSTASIVSSISQLNQATASLQSATASLFTSASNALVTASISGQLLSFTKGNNTQFTLTIPTGSGVYVTGSYGAFQDSTTQSGSANTAYNFKFNTTDVSDGVILSGSTGLKVGAYGVYNLQWSGQAVQGSGAAIVSVWVNVNGIQVSGSRGDVTLPSNTKLLPAWTYLLTLNQNDVVELEWASDSNNTTWQYLPIGSTPTTPAAASIIASLNRVDVGGGSNSVSNATFNVYTASINSATSSLFTSASLALTTASVSGQTMTFTKGNGTTFNVTLPTGSGINTASFATTGSNLFIGNQTITGSVSIQGNTTFTLSNGDASNVRIGSSAMANAITNGNAISVAIGNSAMQNSSGSSQNVAIGNRALFITTGSFNIAIGSETLVENTTGESNVAMGLNALNLNTRGSNNFALGANSLQRNTTGNNNIAVGADSGQNASGSTNIFIGNQSGKFITGSSNTIIGGFTSTAGTILNNNIILADGSGNVKAQYSGSAWSLQDGIKLNKGTNKTCDIVSVNGSVTVTNSLVTTDSIILVTTQNGVVGADEYPAVVNAKGTGTFDIAHSYGGTLSVAYLIINPTA